MPENTPDLEAMLADLEGTDTIAPGANKIDPKKIGMPTRILDAAGLNG